jgi:hypothetical protein
MSYSDLQKALDRQQIKAEDFRCEGMGCKFIMFGEDIDITEGTLECVTDRDSQCPYFEPIPIPHPENTAIVTFYDKKIESHSNSSQYPEPSYFDVENGKIIVKKLRVKRRKDVK